jgi:ribonucleoside-diphosphate reductase beta chain
MGGSELFREFIKENPDIWTDELKRDIYSAIREVIAYEKALIDTFDIPEEHLKITDIYKYLEYSGDQALKYLGMKPNWGVEENPFPFMDDALGISLENFFEARSTEYAKGATTGSWEDAQATLIARGNPLATAGT